MLRRETLTLITLLAPNPPTLRQIMLAKSAFHASSVAQLMVRTRFRQPTPMGRGVRQTLPSMLPNSRQDGREYLVFLGKVYGFRYYINGQRHGVSKHWRANGPLDFKALYHYGKLHGTCIEWRENGQAYRIRDWDHGVPKDSYLQWISQPELEQGHWHRRGSLRIQVGYRASEILRERLVQYEMDDAPNIVVLS